MDENTSKLFVEINPNIDELAKQQEGLAKDDVKNEVIDDNPSSEEQIFDEPPKLTRQRAKKVKYQVEDLSLEEVEATKPSKPKTSAQLEKEERKRLREAEAKAKAMAKEEKRKEGQERNRQKSRDRYRRLAEEKKMKTVQNEKEIRKEIVKDNTRQSRIPQKEPNMDFGTFASYMMKYEDLKLQYAKQQDEKKKIEEAAKPKPVAKGYHPDKYPLQNLYDPRKRYTGAFPTQNFF
tara:strand:+ start:369 stop:1073 length:705 start_codon:yes stop_codon:yes gene_type:complete